tara:strand:- start:19169 stop:19372 length:204 start_codon:yes stop_codon:yes gene_type:complete
MINKIFNRSEKIKYRLVVRRKFKLGRPAHEFMEISSRKGFFVGETVFFYGSYFIVCEVYKKGWVVAN